MFEDRTAESDADFPSSWKQELSVAEQEIQTDECKVSSKICICSCNTLGQTLIKKCLRTTCDKN